MAYYSALCVNFFSKKRFNNKGCGCYWNSRYTQTSANLKVIKTIDYRSVCFQNSLISENERIKCFPCTR